MKTKALRPERRLWAVRSMIVASLLVSLLSWSAGPVFAAGGQFGSISGTIVDSETKAAISGAKVTAASPSGSGFATTGSNGFFTIQGLNIDTYTLSIEAKGYDAISQTGITITGDQTVSLGTVTLSHLKTIVRTTSRSSNGGFQPTQTQDQYTISGARLEQTAGNPNNTKENNLLLAAPGVTLATSGNVTIRGGRLTEVGYQLDGVSFAEPFLSGNGSAGLSQGVSAVQVVEGAGDASQGLVGSGVINVIPKRGTYPGFGSISGAIEGPNYGHQFAFDYGFATANGAISNYIAYNGERFQPYVATPANQYGNGFGASFQDNNQFLDNFVFKFGHNKNQQLQVLYQNDNIVQYGNLSTTNGLFYYNNYPASNAAAAGNLDFAGLGQPLYSQLISLTPYTPAAGTPITGPQQNSSVNTEFLKFEYDNNLDQNTYLALRYYNWSQFQNDDSNYSIGPQNGYVPEWETVGGPTTGGSFNIERQVGSKLNVGLDGLYEVQHPIWNDFAPTFGVLSEFLNAGDSDGANSPGILDYLPVSEGGTGYLASQGITNPGRYPSYGINFNGSYFQQFGGGIRFQYNPVTPLKLDFGVRYEGQNQHFINPFNPLNEGGNPFDVPASQWTSNDTNPREWEPRFAVSYQLGRNDAVRASYGRSSVFSNAQDAGTPLGVYGIPQSFFSVAPKPGFACGNQFGVFFPCTSYAQQLYWSFDRHLDAPDAGGIQPANYNNYDFTYTHLFQNGWGARITPFYKLGTTLPSAALLLTLPNGSQIFAGSSKAFNRTTGVEFNLTTPEKAHGASGFFSATYQNVLQSAPALSNFEANGTPTLSTATLALGDTYRAGYVSPLSGRLGASYKTGGFTITPTLQFDIGYPYSVGNLIAAQIGTTASGAPIYANVPQVNFGSGAPIIVGFYNQVGAALATNFYDPAYSGTTPTPNIAWTRGTPATSNSGGKLWNPNLEADLTLSYKLGRSTLGVSLLNLFGNAFNGSIPAINPFYQPVGTGLSGPQTNRNTACVPIGTTVTGPLPAGCSVSIPKNTYAFQNGAYLLSNGNIEGYQLAPLTPFNVNVFYSLQL